MSNKMFSENSPFDGVFPDSNPFMNCNFPDEDAIYQMLDQKRDVFAYGAAPDDVVKQQALRMVFEEDAALFAASREGDGEGQDCGVQPMPEDSGAPVMCGKARHKLPMKEARENAEYMAVRLNPLWWTSGDMSVPDLSSPD